LKRQTRSGPGQERTVRRRTAHGRPPGRPECGSESVAGPVGRRQGRRMGLPV